MEVTFPVATPLAAKGCRSSQSWDGLGKKKPTSTFKDFQDRRDSYVGLEGVSGDSDDLFTVYINSHCVTKQMTYLEP